MTTRLSLAPQHAPCSAVIPSHIEGLRPPGVRITSASSTICAAALPESRMYEYMGQKSMASVLHVQTDAALWVAAVVWCMELQQQLHEVQRHARAPQPSGP